MLITNATQLLMVGFVEGTSPLDLANKMVDARIEHKRQLVFQVVYDSKKSKFVAFFDQEITFKKTGVKNERKKV